MSTEAGAEGQDEMPTTSDEAPSVFVDAAVRVSNPSAFDDWYYGIEDKLGQGTVGMGVCMVLFVVLLIVAIVWAPI
jgi:hypothetical protein